MLTLHTFGRAFGLPDPSPFVSKAEVLLKLSGLPFQLATGNLNKAPKGKLPYLDDAGTIVADSTFIRLHLEQRHGIDFDKGLSPVQQAIGWSAERMCEEHLYWAIVDSRWLVDENFAAGPAKFFAKVPALARPLVTAMVRRKVRRNLHAHGLGRHARPDIEMLATRDLAAIAGLLGDQPWLLGSEPHGADASVWSFVASVLCPAFATPIRTAAEAMPALVAYRDRGLRTWFPELAGTAGA